MPRKLKPSESAFRRVLLSVTVAIALSRIALPQDAETVKSTMTRSLAKIENYSVGVIKGRCVEIGKSEKTGQLHFRGDKIWFEFEGRNLDEDEERAVARNNASQEIMGTKNQLPVCEFDGKKFYEFDPYILTLRIESVKKLPPKLNRLSLLPTNWLCGGGDRTQSFSRFIEDAKYDLTVKPLGGGRWKLSQSDLGSLLPQNLKSQFVGVKDRYIIVDEKVDFLVTYYHGEGDKIEAESTLEWQKQDGNWYVKHGKQMLNGKPFQEWFIDEISFDATNCRTKFNDLESTVPFATRIDTYNENKSRLSLTYKGGADGETEYKLRQAALSQRDTGQRETESK